MRVRKLGGRDFRRYRTFDIDLALAKSEENPVYYVQYAHARICTNTLHALANPSTRYRGMDRCGIRLSPYPDDDGEFSASTTG